MAAAAAPVGIMWESRELDQLRGLRNNPPPLFLFSARTRCGLRASNLFVLENVGLRVFSSIGRKLESSAARKFYLDWA